MTRHRRKQRRLLPAGLPGDDVEPESVFWFGAFIPQFVDAKGNYVAQIALLGVTTMVVALFSDGACAVLTGLNMNRSRRVPPIWKA